jgi:hypothetical protein
MCLRVRVRNPATAQAWTYKKLGFPLPYLVVGRWGVTPFPCRTQLKFVVGAPIAPPTVPLSGEVGSQLSQSLTLLVAGGHAQTACLHGTAYHGVHKQCMLAWY